MPPDRRILLVEDDPDAIILVKRVLRKAGIENPIDVVTDGERAMSYLTERVAQGEEALPMLVLLDLKLPRTNGFEVLDWIRSQPAMRKLLTVVLSSSLDRRDVAKAYDLGAYSYLPKYPVASDFYTIYKIANAILSVEEMEKLVRPGVKRPV